MRITGRRLDRLRAGRASSSSGASSTAGGSGGRRTRSRCRRRPTALAAHHREGLGDHTAACRRSASGNPGARRGPVRLFTVRAPPAAEGPAHRRGDRHHAGPLDGRADARRCRRHLPRVTDADLVFRDELDALARDRARSSCTTSSATHRGEGARLLSPEHLRELVPDAADRDVFVCGPPAMTEATNRSLRAAGVPRRHVHVERFALT